MSQGKHWNGRVNGFLRRIRFPKIYTEHEFSAIYKGHYINIFRGHTGSFYIIVCDENERYRYNDFAPKEITHIHDAVAEAIRGAQI